MKLGDYVGKGDDGHDDDDNNDDDGDDDDDYNNNDDDDDDDVKPCHLSWYPVPYCSCLTSSDAAVNQPEHGDHHRINADDYKDRNI